MSISIGNIFSGIDKQVPQLAFGQLHTMRFEHPNWVQRLVNHIAEQTKVLYISEPTLPSEHQQRPEKLHDNVIVAEWLLRRRYSMGSALAALDQVAAHTNTVILHVSNSASLWVNFLFQSKNLIALEHWAKSNQKLVYIFISGDGESKYIDELIERSANFFQSYSIIKYGKPHWEWQIDFWFSNGVMLANSFRILETGDGHLEVHQPPQKPSDENILRYESAPVYYLNGALDGNEIAPLEWQMVDPKLNWMSILQRDSDDIIIVPYFRGQSIRELLQTVYNIRRYYGEFLRVCIRERDHVIRYADEKLLFQAGATLILPYDLRFSQVVGLVEYSAGWRCSRTLPDDFNVFLQQIMPGDIGGYCTIKSFAANSVELALIAEQQGLDFSLVYAKPGPGLNVIDILSSFRHRRDGDFISSDGEFIYIFLYGCQSSDIARTLSYLLGMPANTLLQNEKQIHSVYLVEELAKRLNELTEVPTYTDQLATHESKKVGRVIASHNRSHPKPPESAPNIDL